MDIIIMEWWDASTEICSHIIEKFRVDAEHVLPQIVKQKHHLMNDTWDNGGPIFEHTFVYKTKIGEMWVYMALKVNMAKISQR